MHVGDVADEFLNEHRFADARSAEESDLTAARVRRHEVDDFNARFEDARRRFLILQRGRRAVNRPLRRRIDRRVAIDRFAEHVEDASERAFTNRNGDRSTGAAHGSAAHDAVGRPECETTYLVVAEFVLYFQNEIARGHRASAEVAIGCLCSGVDRQDERVVDPRQRLGRKLNVDDVAQNLDDLSGIGSHGVSVFPYRAC